MGLSSHLGKQSPIAEALNIGLIKNSLSRPSYGVYFCRTRLGIFSLVECHGRVSTSWSDGPRSSTKRLNETLSFAKIPPAMNQVNIRNLCYFDSSTWTREYDTSKEERSVTM
ncbi:hypothetical protein V6N12_059944 [Hibiscus sabdariffa]|uniref:Uncharacterized protein n=1 Tax=Hibiscus sabdariffa TaxID=183260 RepID=A0ABR2D2Z5_9ROSI